MQLTSSFLHTLPHTQPAFPDNTPTLAPTLKLHNNNQPESTPTSQTPNTQLMPFLRWQTLCHLVAQRRRHQRLATAGPCELQVAVALALPAVAVAAALWAAQGGAHAAGGGAGELPALEL
jgi:hypothetical protein